MSHKVSKTYIQVTIHMKVKAKDKYHTIPDNHSQTNNKLDTSVINKLIINKIVQT